MAAYINRTLSLMSGDGPHNRPPMQNVIPSLRNSHDASPLQIFVKAKKKINDVFVDIEDYVKDTVAYMHGKFCFFYFVLNSIFVSARCQPTVNLNIHDH